jgi:hypothetical protein
MKLLDGVVAVGNLLLSDVSNPRTRPRFQTEMLATRALQITKTTINRSCQADMRKCMRVHTENTISKSPEIYFSK